MKHFINITIIITMVLLTMVPCNHINAAGAVTNVSYQSNITMAPLDGELMKSISESTPVEPESSDLAVWHPATRLSTARLPQSYTFDDTYFYYLTNTTNVGSKKDTLRLTRVKYEADGTYTEEFMTLANFGHGTNIDCVTVNGTTWLWTGSDHDKTISCFNFQSGKTLKNHAKTYYSITKKGTKKKVKKVAPAIDASGKYLVVRYKENGKQCYQYYKLINGRKIKSKKIVKKVKLNLPKTTFQGFDVAGNYIYTVEGTRSAEECAEISETYEPIRIRAYDIKTKKCNARTIWGAQSLLHREPEGIKVNANGQIFLNISSHYKDLYTCVNVYQVK